MCKIRFSDKRNHPMYGTKFSPETRKKISISNIGRYTGENTHLSKMKNNQIIEIKNLLTNSYLSIEEIANRYNISSSTIYSIRKKKTWVDIGSELDNILLECVRNDTIVIPIKLIIDIKNALAYTNMSLMEMSIKYKVNRKTLKNIITEKLGGKLNPELNEIIKNRNVTKRNGQLVGRILEERDVIEVKQLLLNGELTQEEISKQYNVSEGLVCAIKNNKRYKDVGNEFNENLINTKSKTKAGERNNKSKLKEKDILEIKKTYIETNLNIIEIGKMFNVSDSTISSILNKNTWSYIETQYDDKIEDMMNNSYKFPSNKSKLTSNDVIEIKKMMYDGLDDKSIAEKFNVTKTSINAIRVGRKWKSVKTEYDEFIGKNKRCITKEIAKEIKDLIANGYTKNELMDKYNISSKVVDNIIFGRTWKSI